MTTTITPNRNASRTLLRLNGRYVGFIYQTTSGLWRGYSYVISIGYGPFNQSNEASEWVFSSAHRPK